MYKGEYDFCGWVTKNNLRCADGVVIRHGAFQANDGQRVPLVWNHDHGHPSQILGHAILENRNEGVYGYCKFNNTQSGQDAKECIMHGDVVSMSIWANEINRIGNDIVHGNIREVSLVVAGANPGAYVESVVCHGEPMDESDIEGIFYTGSEDLIITHSLDVDYEDEENEDEDDEEETIQHSADSDMTIEDVLDTMNDTQKTAVAAIVGQLIAENQNDEDEEDDEMGHNLFEGQGSENYISHAVIEGIFADAKAHGSLKEAVMAAINSDDSIKHSIPTEGMVTSEDVQTYGVNDPSFLFPEFRNLNNPPEWISRNMDWVQKVIGRVHRTPFSRIKSQYANITEDEARARGYIKGNQKKEEVFSTLKRTTEPQTIYKRQKLDRDDINDITDFDIVAWIKAEMRVMLNEEFARAILLGDGRSADSDDKIKEDRIRPICKDVALFNTKYIINVPANATEEEVAKAVIRAAIKSRKNYKGSGNPDFFTTEDYLTDMLLIEDGIGHKLYKTESELTTALRAKEIITVEPMEGATVTYNSEELPLVGIIVNLKDYNVGADKGGEINLFDDFDIDFNQYKYLIETRISGALIKPFSAITLLLKRVTAGGGTQPTQSEITD